MARLSGLSRSIMAVSWIHGVGTLLSLSILLVGLVVPFGIDWQAQLAITVFLFTIVLWLTKPIPLSISSTLSVTLLATLGVVDSYATAVSGFSSRLVFFLLLLFLIGDTISTVNLDNYIAGRLLSSSSTPERTYTLLVRNVLFLAFIMPSGIARTVTFTPIIRRLSDQYKFGETNNFLRSSFLLLGQLNPITSLALMTGGGMAILSSEIIREAGFPITWLDWAFYMAPPIILVYVSAALVIAHLYPVDNSETVDETQDNSELTGEQQLVGVTIVVMIVLWIVGSIVGLSTIVPPMLAVTVLAAPGIAIITADNVREVNWGILLLFGAVFSHINALSQTGAMDLIIDSLLNLVPLGEFPTWLAVASILAGVLLLRLLFSTASACLAITLPVVISLTSSLGINSLYTAFAVITVVGSTTLLPFHLPPVLIVKEEYPALRNRDVFTVGLLTLFFAAVFSALSWLVYWPIL